MSSRLLVRVFFLFYFSRNGIGEIIFVLKIINSLKPSRWWSSDKNLELKSLLFLWFQVWNMWLLIWWPLEAYMVVNFRTRGINRDARKLVGTTILNLKKKIALGSSRVHFRVWKVRPFHVLFLTFLSISSKLLNPRVVDG